MINVELAIATGGDHGVWGTNFISIPLDTPENDIEIVAIKAYKALLVLQGLTPEIQHMWLYHWEIFEEDGG